MQFGHPGRKLLSMVQAPHNPRPRVRLHTTPDCSAGSTRWPSIRVPATAPLHVRYSLFSLPPAGRPPTIGKTKTNKNIGHHARPRRASATAPLRTGADTCKTGSGAGKRSGAKSDLVRRRSNHAWTGDQAGKQKCANIDAVGGWRVHTADDTPSRNAVTRSKHCNFMCQGDIRPRAAAGSSRNGTTQAVAAVTGIRLVGNAASNTASASSDPEHTRKRSSRRRVSTTELSRPGIHWHSNSRCSMWRHLCSLAA